VVEGSTPIAIEADLAAERLEILQEAIERLAQLVLRSSSSSMVKRSSPSLRDRLIRQWLMA